jgi:hypothetical protein
VRTWDDNRASINQLWPQCQWTEEERRLLGDDLAALDQDVLYDALRNVKRNHDTLYPQLKWMLESYRELVASKKHASRPAAPKGEKLALNINEDEDRRLRDEFIVAIDVASPADFEHIEAMVLDKLPKMSSASALRVLNYARARLLGQEQTFSRVTRSGDLAPISFATTK